MAEEEKNASIACEEEHEEKSSAAEQREWAEFSERTDPIFFTQTVIL